MNTVKRNYATAWEKMTRTIEIEIDEELYQKSMAKSE